jgi:hypothetical protein
MPIIDFDTGTWADPWVQELPPLAKMLFNYLWTNDHINLACLYSISIRTISNETGLSQKQVQDILTTLHPKVKYDPGKNLMWVVNFVKRQFLRTGTISPKIVLGIRKALMGLPEGHPLVYEFLKKYHTLSIDYPYPMDTFQVREREGVRVGNEEKEKGVGEGKEERVEPKTNPVKVESEKLATLLLEKIRERKSDFSPGDNGALIEKWAKPIATMLRKNRDPTRIREVILWAQEDQFWQNNILGGEKLQEKFDQLEMKMIQAKKREGPGSKNLAGIKTWMETKVNETNRGRDNAIREGHGDPKNLLTDHSKT